MRLRLTSLLPVPLLAILIATPVSAQSGGVFEITRSTIDGGGSTERSVNDISIRGTIGQPDVGAAGAGTTVLRGGFWASDGLFGLLFTDGFESGDTAAWSTAVGAVAAPEPAQAEGPIELPRVSSTTTSSTTGLCPDDDPCTGRSK